MSTFSSGIFDKLSFEGLIGAPGREIILKQDSGRSEVQELEKEVKTRGFKLINGDKND